LRTNQFFWLHWHSQKHRCSSIGAWWDAGKIELKKRIHKFSKDQAQHTKICIKSLQASVFHLNRRLANGEDVEDFLQQAKFELEDYLLKQAKGAQVRAHIQWTEDGERCTSFFFRQEKTRRSRSIIKSISRPDGSFATTSQGILQVFRSYYQDLFTSESLDEHEQQFFISNIQFRLNKAECRSCEGPMLQEECFKALKNMSHNKSPGLDGIPAEFYLHFWSILGEDFTAMINECYDLGCLTMSQRNGLITLLFKRGDRNNTKNWRPITLLCADYKIASKVIANRLLTVTYFHCCFSFTDRWNSGSPFGREYLSIKRYCFARK
jgi:hypothetical protein